MGGNKVIYTPGGRASEYADLALNLYSGCSHGCLYCYAPLALRRDRVKFHANVAPRKDILKKIRKDAPEHKGKEVFMCFSCDPYPSGVNTSTTREAIKILHSHGVGVNILTKGGLRMLRDMDLMISRPELSRVGATLTFAGYLDSCQDEPHAAAPSERIEMLQRAHEAGIDTWVSLEPVIVPQQTLELITLSAPYVDHYKVGMLNYDPRAKAIDWAAFLRDATALLTEFGKDFYIKKDLAVYSDKGLV